MSNSDFNYRNNSDPSRPNDPYDPDARTMNATWGWIAAAVFLVVVLAIAFGMGHQGKELNTASNDPASPPPATTRMAPPATPNAPQPIAPTPNSPAQRSNP
jgi:cell division protein FtsN